MERVICLVIGYICGLFQTGYFYGKHMGMDIREHGSGNAGTTNTLRVLGFKAGAIVFIGDLLKAVAACTIVRFLYGNAHPELTIIYALYAGIGVVLGHNYPFYLGFKGGKGIAATAGVLVAMGNLPLLLSCLFVFLLAVAITRYVSLGSLLVVTVFFIEWIWFTSTGYIEVSAYRMESIILVFIFTAMAFWRHKANIKRLLAGTENKIGSKKES